MKNVVFIVLLLVLTGCRKALIEPSDWRAKLPGEASTQVAHARPSAILADASQPSGLRPMIYQDDDYAFFKRGYGAKGDHVPGLFLFSKKQKKWMKIRKLSTDRAKLGRSPTDEEAAATGKGPCSVGWNYSQIRESDYVTLPLMTSGSVNFPDKIVYDREPLEYLLQFNSSWNIDGVLTQFVVKKKDIDQAFQE